MLWDSKGGGLKGFFKKGLKEDLTSWQNHEGELCRYIKGSWGILVKEVELTGISTRSIDSLPTWKKEWKVSKIGLRGGEDIWHSLRFL